MNDSHLSREELIEQIRAAFKDVTQGTISISESDVIDGYGSDEQRAVARAGDKEKHWWEISDDKVAINGYALCFVDTQSWVYLLPAFMVFAVRYGPEESQAWHTLAYDQAVFHLHYLCEDLRKLNVKGLEHLPSVPHTDQVCRAIEKYSLLSCNQRNTIAEFLRYMYMKHDVESAEAALQIWSTLDPSRVR